MNDILYFVLGFLCAVWVFLDLIRGGLKERTRLKELVQMQKNATVYGTGIAGIGGIGMATIDPTKFYKSAPDEGKG